jgi:Luciferase-like monooxygenase
MDAVDQDHDNHVAPRIGLGLPAAIPDAPARATVEWAGLAEDLGFPSLAVIDRLVYDNYDPFVALAAAAAVTEDAELFTTVLNVPWRQSALMLAKQLWSLERVSGGRLIAGLALGGWPDDYRESGIGLGGRGAVFDDMLQVMLRAWKGAVSGAGGPLPALPPGRPRLLFGGFAPPSYERMAAFGIGWVGPLFGFDVLLNGIASAQAAWSAAGRPGRPRIVVGRYFSLGAAPTSPPTSTSTTTTVTSSSAPRVPTSSPPRPTYTASCNGSGTRAATTCCCSPAPPTSTNPAASPPPSTRPRVGVSEPRSQSRSVSGTPARRRVSRAMWAWSAYPTTAATSARRPPARARRNARWKRSTRCSVFGP